MVRTGDIIFRTAMHELQRLERGGQNRIPFFIFTPGSAYSPGGWPYDIDHIPWGSRDILAAACSSAVCGPKDQDDGRLYAHIHRYRFPFGECGS